MRIGVRAKGTPWGAEQTRRAREKLRWSLGRHGGAVDGAYVQMDVEECARCRVRLVLSSGETIEVETQDRDADRALGLGIERAASALARTLDTAKLWGGGGSRR